MRFYLKVLLMIGLLSIYSCSKDNPTQPIFENEELNNSALLVEINFARSNPKQYAKLLKEKLQYFDGNYYKEPGQITLITTEGAAAYQEAINFLESVEFMPEYTLSSGLCKACLDHANDQGPKGALGHTGSDGSSPWDRMARYGKASGSKAENISYGCATARDVIIQLIVDDGVVSRGHRDNIFDKKLLVIGFASNSHKKYEFMTVMDFASSFQEKSKTYANFNSKN